MIIPDLQSHEFIASNSLRALIYIHAKRAPVTTTQIREAIDVERPSMQRVVQILQRHEYITTVYDQGVHNTHQITPSGVEYIERSSELFKYATSLKRNPK